jgi:HD superfamily phosphohydrolase
MITRGITLGIEEDNFGWLRKLYSFDGSEDFINNFLTWDDQRLFNHILYVEKSDGYAKKIFKRLKDRNLYKRVFHEKVPNFNKESRLKLSKINNDPKILAELEEEISNCLSVEIGEKIDKLEVILKKFSIKSVRESSKDNESAIMVLDHQGIPSNLDDESTLFKPIDDKELEEFVEVYAPLNIDPEKKEKILNKLYKPLFLIIEKKLTDQLSLESL